MSGQAVNIDEVFTSFHSPMDNLKSLFEVQSEDDIWFDQAKGKKEIKKFAKILKDKYTSTRGRAKRDQAALHDAILLFWLKKQREEKGSNIWLITTDTTLPGSLPPNTSSKSLAITLDALLQWISPIVVPEGEEDSFTAIFSEMIKYRVLPQEKIFTLEDFLIFHEMHLSCKELPAEDVEECIRYIKVNAPTLDPLNPADRETLFYEVSKFFTSPGRKYKTEIERLESENIKIKQEFEKKIEELKERYEKDLKERDRKIEELIREFSEYKEKTEEVSLKRSAWRRVLLTTLVFLLVEGLVIFLANQYGEGPNLYQKISHSWYFLVVGAGLTTLIGWFIIGKRRLQALGWPFTKIFKQE
jgi:hypothetical protein